MASKFFMTIGLTGGTTGMLDAIDGDNLSDDDSAIVITSTAIYFFHLDATSGAVESSPNVIAPDDNAGDKRWLLVTSTFVAVSGGQAVSKTNVVDTDYGTSALTTDYIVAFTSLSAARAAVISSEDVASGTTTQPRVMIIKDEAGSAETYNITISLESGTINGEATYVLNTDYEAVNIYLNGSNGFAF